MGIGRARRQREGKSVSHTLILSLFLKTKTLLLIQAGYKPKDDTWEPEVWIGGSRAREEERERERERERGERSGREKKLTFDSFFSTVETQKQKQANLKNNILFTAWLQKHKEKKK